VLIALVVWRFRALIQPLILAAVIAYLLNPLVNLITRRTRFQRTTAVAIVYLGFILIMLALLVGIGFVAVDQTDRLLEALPTLVQRTTVWLDSQWHRTISVGPVQITPADQIGDISVSRAVNQGLAWLQENFTRGGTLAASVFSATISVLSTFFVVMFVAIYLSRDTPLLWRKVAETANAPGYQRDAERLSRDFVRIWNAYLRGQILLGLAMFVLVSITLAALGVNYALGLGALGGLLEFLPVVGPVVSAIAAALVALFQDSNWLGLSPFWYVVVVLVAMFALQQLEQAVLVPRFVGGELDLHPVVVIVVVLMGTSLAGILGAVLAAPVAATVKLLGGYGWRKMFDLPPFPEPEPPEEPESRTGLLARLRNLVGRRT
jgi:predicted PurR-regulated permease PerM